MTRIHLDVAVFGTTGDVEVDLTITEAVGLRCIRCGQLTGPMISVGRVVDTGDELFAHISCEPRSRP